MPEFLGIGPWLKKPRPYDEDLGPVRAAHVDSNAPLIADAARLYIPDGAFVLDMTYGEGAFWRDTDLTRFYLSANDTRGYTVEEHDKMVAAGVKGFFAQDYHSLSMRDDYFDVVVFDPPYKSGGAHDNEPMNEQYGLEAIKSDTPSGHGNVKGLLEDYEAGIREAARVVMKGGLVWVKCQDFVESGKQHWMHALVPAIGEKYGLVTKDLFVLVNTGKQRMRHKSQHHARKNVSYLWVFLAK